MSFTHANPSELKILTQALDLYCDDHGIVVAAERSNAAQLMIALFRKGLADPRELKGMLDVLDGK